MYNNEKLTGPHEIFYWYTCGSRVGHTVAEIGAYI